MPWTFDVVQKFPLLTHNLTYIFQLCIIFIKNRINVTNNFITYLDYVVHRVPRKYATGVVCNGLRYSNIIPL